MYIISNLNIVSILMILIDLKPYTKDIIFITIFVGYGLYLHHIYA